MILRVKIYASPAALVAGSLPIRSYKVDGSDRTERRVMGEQCRNAHDGGQVVVSYVDNFLEAGKGEDLVDVAALLEWEVILESKLGDIRRKEEVHASTRLDAIDKVMNRKRNTGVWTVIDARIVGGADRDEEEEASA